jgi:predicted phosphate transport protein (TIGR00153 family)
MAFSLLPREDEYFILFSQMTEKIQDASNTLVEMMTQSRESGSFESYAKRIKDIEHGCDELTHTVTTKLNKSFITPFDREDIFTLCVALDDVCDYIDAGARAIIMYGIKEVSEHARGLAKVIQGLAMEINSAVSMLAKPDGMNQHIVEIHRLENEADDIYFRAIGELFQNQTDAMTVIKWKELYEILENATDRCESVANIVESIILKQKTAD